MPDFKPGDKAVWVGNAGMFRREVTVEEVRNAYLTIFGQKPEDGETVYDINDSVIGGTVFGVRANELEAITPAVRDVTSNRLGHALAALREIAGREDGDDDPVTVARHALDGDAALRENPALSPKPAPDLAADMAAEMVRPVVFCPAETGTKSDAAASSLCSWWSDPSDDFYGICVKEAYHDREGDPEHENKHGIRWTGDRWEWARPSLPRWEDLTDLDRGAALLHIRKRDREGREYAIIHCPARYFDHPALTALDAIDASDHAASLETTALDLQPGEYERLYDLAAKAQSSR